jgi:hypothetical protein
MSTHVYRSAEPLYMIVVHSPNAEKLLRAWGKSAHNAQVSIEGNRMRIYEQRSYELFRVQWEHNWDQVVIWDCWNRRHIYHN